MDVAADDGAVLVADAHVASGVGAARLVALDALDDAVEDREHRLAQRRAEIDAAMAELALGRTRLRTRGAETTRLVQWHRAARAGERMEPADHRRQRLGRLFAGTPRTVGDARRIGRNDDGRELGRCIEALEIGGDRTDAAAHVAHDDAVRFAAEPIAVTAQ